MLSSHSSQSVLENQKSSSSKDTVNTYLRIRPCKKRSSNYGFFEDSFFVQKKDGNSNKKPIYYSFNAIFEEDTTQEDLFMSTTLPLVKEFLIGQNYLLFSYGITSSGKSYTMKGTPDAPGLVPHSLKTIFQALGPSIPTEKAPLYKISKFCDIQKLNNTQRRNEEKFKNKVISLEDHEFSDQILSQISIEYLLENDEIFFTDNEDCSIWISYYEIYNEKIFDLLRPETELQVVTSEKNYYLRNITNVYVTSAADALAVFLKGQKNLHVDATNLNEHSSRSHSVFTLSLLKTDRSTKQTSISKLSFADLAGNERVKKIGLEKIAETTNINKSLMSLSRCIQGLKNKSTLIPVRDSNLTKALQPYLINTGGKMTLIFNLNPSQHLFEESSNSLDFCAASQKIAQKQVDKFRQTVVTEEDDPTNFESYDQNLNESSLFLEPEIIDEMLTNEFQPTPENAKDFQIVNEKSFVISDETPQKENKKVSFQDENNKFDKKPQKKKQMNLELRRILLSRTARKRLSIRLPALSSSRRPYLLRSHTKLNFDEMK